MIHVIASFSWSCDSFSQSFHIYNANNRRNSPSCPFPALMTPFSKSEFINGENTGCVNKPAIGAINEEAIGVIIAPRNPCPYFFYFMFYCFSSTIIPESSSDFMILIILFITSFEMNKVNPFPPLNGFLPIYFTFKIVY